MSLLLGVFATVLTIVTSLPVLSYCPISCQCTCDKKCDINCSEIPEEQINQEKLDLSSKNLETFSVKSKALKKLDLSNNDIRDLSISKIDCPDLEYLNLRNNSLQSSSALLSWLKSNNLSKLKTLIVSNNNFETFDLDLPGNIKHLIIEDNQIRWFLIPNKTTSLETIWLKGNDFECQCEDPEFKKLYLFLEGKVRGKSCGECLKVWYPHKESDWDSLKLCFMVFVIVIVVLVGMCACYKHFIDRRGY